MIKSTGTPHRLAIRALLVICFGCDSVIDCQNRGPIWNRLGTQLVVGQANHPFVHRHQKVCVNSSRSIPASHRQAVLNNRRTVLTQHKANVIETVEPI